VAYFIAAKISLGFLAHWNGAWFLVALGEESPIGPSTLRRNGISHG